jgi:molybdopterin-binding protein
VAKASTPRPPLLGLAEHVCLALVVEGVGHGWALGGLLAPGAEVGRVWSLSRPLTYRAVDALADKGLLTRTEQRAPGGRERRALRATRAGRAATRRWLAEPVAHPRDVRTELLVKLVLLERRGLPTTELLDAQAAAFSPTLDALTAPSDPDVVALWRREHARAVRRFLSAALARGHRNDGDGGDEGATTGLALSARNQLRATVGELELGDVLGTVRSRVAPGQLMTATITRTAIEELDLAEGDEVLMVTKATETMVARRPSSS